MNVRHLGVVACTAFLATFASAVPAFADEAATAPVESPAEASDRRVVHDVEIESVQVAVADTGNNRSESVLPTPASGATPGTDLATGAATATGSADDTTIEQRVDTQLSDSATASVVQISIVFNIGAAVANSGHNELASSSSGGGGPATIATGSADALGNDAATYITQGASGRAAAGEQHTVDQRTTTLRIGLSTANTGQNAVSTAVGTTVGPGGPATTGTGNATAIGNLASTAITQLAAVRGTGTAALNIEQRATVVNFGLAVADTGFNQIGTDLAAALNAGDDGALEQLLALLLPSLVASASAAPTSGSGTVSTGDALAIGNRSTTEVLQVAVGASDSGSVDISQRVTVVNAGAASATTGRNTIGSSGDPHSSTSPEADAVVGELATFLRSLLFDVDAWIGGSVLEGGTRVLATSLGDFDIGMDRTIAARTAGSHASAVTTRQLAAVVNLAIARANSGANRATTDASIDTSTDTSGAPIVDRLADPAASRTPDASGADAVLVVGGSESVLIVTGAASSKNTSVIVVCQRADLAELQCLAPPEPETAPSQPEPDVTDVVIDTDGPVAAAPPNPVGSTPSNPVGAKRPADGGTLPATGSDPRGLIVVALVLLVFGSSLRVVVRRPS